MKVVKLFIWLGFTALLAVSIPKVAWVFRSYEGTGVSLVTLHGITIDILWLVPLFVSLCIDALILATTYAVSVDKTKAAQGFMWAFVSLLAALSCYCNLLYNNAHAPNGSIWANGLVGMVTPVVISCVPLFALCYTLILSRIEGKGETLEEKAARLEDEKGAKDRIRQARKGTWKNRVMDTITDTKDVASQVFKKPALSETFSQQKFPESESTSELKEPELFSESAPDVAELPEESAPTSEEISSPRLGMIERAMYDALMKNPVEAAALQRLSQEQSIDEFTDMLKQRYSQYAGYITPQRVANVMQFIARTSEQKSDESVPEIAPAKRKYVMTFQEASEYTGYEISTLKQQLKKGEIQATSSGKLLISSLKIKSGNTGKIVAIKSVEKGA